MPNILRQPKAKHAPIGSSGVLRAVLCPPSLRGAGRHRETDGAARGTRLHQAVATGDVAGLDDFERLGVQRALEFVDQQKERYAALGQKLVSEHSELRVEILDREGGYLSHGTADRVLLYEHGAVLIEFKFHPQGSFSEAAVDAQLAFQAAGVLQLREKLRSAIGIAYAPYTGYTFERKYRRQVIDETVDSILVAEEDYLSGKDEYRPSLDACQYCSLLGTCKAAADVAVALERPKGLIPGIEETSDGLVISDEKSAAEWFERAKLAASFFDAHKEELKVAISQTPALRRLKLKRGRKMVSIPDQERLRGNGKMNESILIHILGRKAIGFEDIVEAMMAVEQLSREDAETAAADIVGDNIRRREAAPSVALNAS